MADDYAVLDHPDPDPELLPAVIPPDAIMEQRAGHICRAILREEADIEKLEEAMQADQAAWARAIMQKRERIAAWKQGILNWMQGNNVTKLTTPWFSAFIRAGRSKIVVDDQQKAIELLKALKQDKAIVVKESIVKQEFDSVYNALPKHFEGVAHDEQGEPGLTIRRKDAK